MNFRIIASTVLLNMTTNIYAVDFDSDTESTSTSSSSSIQTDITNFTPLDPKKLSRTFPETIKDDIISANKGGVLPEYYIDYILDENNHFSVLDTNFFHALSKFEITTKNGKLSIHDWCQSNEHSQRPEVQWLLGIMDLNGFGIPEKNPLSAIFWFKSSLDHGYKPALIGYSHALIQFGHTKTASTTHNEDYGRAINIIKKSAKEGYMPALHYKALLLNTGLWVLARDPKKANKILKNLADQGYDPAIKDLSKLGMIKKPKRKSYSAAGYVSL